RCGACRAWRCTGRARGLGRAGGAAAATARRSWRGGRFIRSRIAWKERRVSPNLACPRSAVSDARTAGPDAARARPESGSAATPPAGSPTPPFLWAATLLALVGGFGLGGSLFLHQTAWRFPAAQAHGHLQLFGWAGLLVLGVGLHFLPRLRGTRLVAPELA